MTIHQRLTADPSAWGLSQAEYARREKDHRRTKAKMRREKAIAALRENRTIGTEIEPSTGHQIVDHHGERAYQVERMQAIGAGFSRTRITLPFVSIQHRSI